jgi:hypothetical protein
MPRGPDQAAQLQANADLQWRSQISRGAWVVRAAMLAFWAAWPLVDGDVADAWQGAFIVVAIDGMFWASWWHTHRKARRARLDCTALGQGGAARD